MDFVFDYGYGYSAFQIIFYLIFAAVIGCFIVTAVRGIRTWHKNNNSPRLTVHATVVSKRQNTSVHHHHNDNTAMHTSTSPLTMRPSSSTAATAWSCTSPARTTASWPRATPAT